MLVWGKVSLILIPQRMFTGVDSFVLMAVPLFMLAGELMGTSGILGRLLRFADVLVGGVRGGSPRSTSSPQWCSRACPAPPSPTPRRWARR
jgi:TRAP-type mannitol/chloroaromatic compound transport system permease large subunit